MTFQSFKNLHARGQGLRFCKGVHHNLMLGMTSKCHISFISLLLCYFVLQYDFSNNNCSLSSSTRNFLNNLGRTQQQIVCYCRSKRRVVCVSACFSVNTTL